MNHKYPTFRVTYQIRSIVSVLFICLLLAVSFQTQPVMAMDHSRMLLNCTGSGCDGYLPGYWGCDVNPTTVSSRYILLPDNVGITELRYQTNCKAFWSRTRLTASSYYIGATLDRNETMYNDYSISSSVPLSAVLSVYTLMGSSYYSSRTCGTANPTSPVPAPVYTNCGIFMTKSN